MSRVSLIIFISCLLNNSSFAANKIKKKKVIESNYSLKTFPLKTPAPVKAVELDQTDDSGQGADSLAVDSAAVSNPAKAVAPVKATEAAKVQPEVNTIPDGTIYDHTGLTINAGETREYVDSSRWSLSSKENISTYTPNNKQDALKEVRILRDPASSKITAVRVDALVSLGKGVKIPSKGFFSSWGSSDPGPGLQVASTYLMKNSIAREIDGAVIAVNKNMCRGLFNDMDVLNDCANKLEKLDKMGPILDPADSKALKGLSDDVDKEATNIHAAVPKRIRDAFQLCESLNRYSKIDEVGVFPISVPTGKPYTNQVEIK